MSNLMGGTAPAKNISTPGSDSATADAPRLHKAIKASMKADNNADNGTTSASISAALRGCANDAEACVSDSDEEIEPDGELLARPSDFKRRGRGTACFKSKSEISHQNITHTANMVMLSPTNPDEGLIVRTCENHADWNLAVMETRHRAAHKPRWRRNGFNSEQHFQQALAEQYREEQIMAATPHKATILPFHRVLDS